MNLEQVTAELRPRGRWEAVDLGVAMVRADFWRLFATWWLAMLPVVGLGLLLVLSGYPWWFVVWVWWWVPLGSRMVLFRLSRSLFGDRPSFRDQWREWPRALKRRWGYRFLRARFSPWGPLTMAVEDLEGLRGWGYRVRCRNLLRQESGMLLVLSAWKSLLLGWLTLTVFSMLILFLSHAEQEEWQYAFRMWGSGGGLLLPLSGKIGLLGSFLLSLSLTDLFATGIGFTLYVNERSWLEGWDVELAFRKLAARLARVAVVAILAVGVLAPMASGEGEKQVIEEILADPVFENHIEKKTHWGPKRRRKPSSQERKSRWFYNKLWNNFLTVLQVLLIAAGVVGLMWLIYRYRDTLRHIALPGKRNGSEVRTRVIGGEIVSAPENYDAVGDLAWQEWQLGRHREALAMLYRGAIFWVAERGGIELGEAATESEFLREVSGARVPQWEYFAALTRAWIGLAYARQNPGDDFVSNLCRDWPYRERGAA